MMLGSRCLQLVLFFSVAWALIIVTAGKGGNEFADVEDNDFAEFDLDEEELAAAAASKKQEEQADDDFEDEDEEEFVNSEPPGDEDDAVVEDEDSEFSHFEDEEEFEGYKQDSDEFEHQPRKAEKPPPPKTINIAKVPAHLRNNWENYYLEILMVIGILVYFINFFSGKTKNQRIANAWFNSHKALLESNFALVGDDGAKDVDDIETQMQKDSENIFSLWCSGRVCCEGMLVELKLLKRQDLVSVIANLMKPSHDQIQIKVNMNQLDMDTFVFCLANKKAATKLAKEMADINTFCPERRPGDKYGIPSNYCIMSEIAEVSSAMLDSKMIAILTKYPDVVDSIHFSDQYTGPKPSDDQAPMELPQGKRVLIFTFNIILKGKPLEDAVENMKPMMLLAFYYMDKVRRYKLSREAKNKADKNRSKVTEAFWKSIHAAKAEKAQEERERKRREVKERIREIEDPDKQRKLEDREARREKKRAQPKMKQLKVKAM